MDIQVLNTEFELVGVVDIYESLIWTDKYDIAGEFELYTKVTSNNINLLQTGRYLRIPESDKTMIIESINIKTDVENGDNFIIKGQSFEIILNRRIFWDTLSIDASLEDGIIELLTETFIDPESYNWLRKVTNFIYEASGNSVIEGYDLKTLAFIMDNLYDTIVTICKSFGIGFKITINNENNIVFKLYLGEDRSLEQTENDVVLFSSELDNLLQSDYLKTITNDKTVAHIMATFRYDDDDTITGQLEVIICYSPYHASSVSGLERKELGIDMRDILTVYGVDSAPVYLRKLDQMEQRCLEDFEFNKERTFFDGQIEINGNYKYLKDYFLGDIVQFIDKYGHGGKAIIKEVTYSENINGINIYPTFESIN